MSDLPWFAISMASLVVLLASVFLLSWLVARRALRFGVAVIIWAALLGWTGVSAYLSVEQEVDTCAANGGVLVRSECIDRSAVIEVPR